MVGERDRTNCMQARPKEPIGEDDRALHVSDVGYRYRGVVEYSTV